MLTSAEVLTFVRQCRLVPNADRVTHHPFPRHRSRDRSRADEHRRRRCIVFIPCAVLPSAHAHADASNAPRPQAAPTQCRDVSTSDERSWVARRTLVRLFSSEQRRSDNEVRCDTGRMNGRPTASTRPHPTCMVHAQNEGLGQVDVGTEGCRGSGGMGMGCAAFKLISPYAASPSSLPPLISPFRLNTTMRRTYRRPASSIEERQLVLLQTAVTLLRRSPPSYTTFSVRHKLFGDDAGARCRDISTSDERRHGSLVPAIVDDI
ncbi:hypothetical protein SCHPADRAFT_1003478 [Schizopora paradoxa]|uniref:Uncharacterized protein n=1 Tax=Schizopora paradoxa TaxID=27342 RepID=A0A0H2RFS5_9AGAM|nr:hypothetical protein SCHPADRAFT_1003478 [Schizopora paradoxa]